jgi:Calcineurin-like phosphoesterase
MVENMKSLITSLLLLLNFNVLSFENLVFSTDKPIYVIGDIHGDLLRAQNLLRGLSLIDKNNDWIGGASVLVQTGDRIDRWHQDYETLIFFDELELQAKNAGGRVFNLVGNHELINTVGEILWYSTEESYLPFQKYNHLYSNLPKICLDNYEKAKQEYINSANPDYIERVQEEIKHKEGLGLLGRVAAFCPGGPLSKMLAKNYGVLIVNNIVFAHGSLEKQYSSLGRDGLSKFNQKIEKWFNGELSELASMDDDTAPFKSRYFAEDFTEDKCNDLTSVLKDIKATQMIIGHTIQETGITSSCQNKLFRIDTGISRGFNFTIPKLLQALKITNNKTEILSVDDEFRDQDLIIKSLESIKLSTFSCDNYIPSNLSYNRCSYEIATKIFNSFLDNSVFYQARMAKNLLDLININNPLANANNCIFQIKDHYVIFSHGLYIPLGQEQEICRVQSNF